MTKEREKETIKYLEFLKKEYLEDAKQRKENGEIIGHGTMEDIDKLRALYIGFALNMIKEKDKTIEKLRNNNKDLLRKLRNRVKEVKKLQRKDYKSIVIKQGKTLEERAKQLKKKDRQIDLMARAFKQDDVKTVEEIKQYFEKEDVE